MYHGDIRLESTIDFKFTTRSFTTGAPTTLAGTPVISAYPSNSVTQLTAGITLTVDFDAVTGLHNVRVVATAANGYATATNYALVITTGTVGGVSVVGEVIGSFSIEARSALMPTTAARTLDVSAAGEAGLDWANVGSPTTTVGLSGTTVATVTTTTTATNVTTVNGLAANVITAAATAADFGTEVAAAVWDRDATLSQTQGTFGQAIGDPVLDADTLWGLANTNLDAATSSRMATYAQPTGFLAATFPGSVASPTNITAATGVVLSGVTHTGAVIPTVSVLTGHTPQTGDSFARIGATGSGLTSLASQASVTAVDDFVDTEIADIQARLPAALVGGRMDSSTGAMAANVVTAAAVADGAIDRATFAADTGLQTFRSNTAQAGAATTITLDAGASAVDNFYNNALVVLTGGTGVGQSRFISAYVGATRVATVAAWVTNPDATTTFAILPFDAVAGASAPTAAQNATAVWDRTRASHVTAGTFGEGAASVQGNVTGSVGSVTGAVGSVTGAVGSVTGLTASNLDATVSSRLATAGYTTPPTSVENADTLLDRNMATGTDSGSSTVRTVRQALRFLRNRWAIAGGTLTVNREDDATASWTATVTTTAGNPVSEVDPAG